MQMDVVVQIQLIVQEYVEVLQWLMSVVYVMDRVQMSCVMMAPWYVMNLNALQVEVVFQEDVTYQQIKFSNHQLEMYTIILIQILLDSNLVLKEQQHQLQQEEQLAMQDLRFQLEDLQF